MKITTHICKTLDLGVSGNLFGGQLMYWLDEAASVYAIWATGEKRVVTRRISEAFFNKPIHAGARPASLSKCWWWWAVRSAFRRSVPLSPLMKRAKKSSSTGQKPPSVRRKSPSAWGVLLTVKTSENRNGAPDLQCRGQI